MRVAQRTYEELLETGAATLYAIAPGDAPCPVAPGDAQVVDAEGRESLIATVATVRRVQTADVPNPAVRLKRWWNYKHVAPGQQWGKAEAWEIGVTLGEAPAPVVEDAPADDTPAADHVDAEAAEVVPDAPEPAPAPAPKPAPRRRK